MRAEERASVPSWLVGPGLIVPPFFLAMLLCEWARPVPPSVPLPLLDEQAADRHVMSVVGRADRFRPSSLDEVVLRMWRAQTRMRLQQMRSGVTPDDLPPTLANVRAACDEVVLREGEERLSQVASTIGVGLLRAALGLYGDPAGGRRALESVGGPFLRNARLVGLLDRVGRLRAHPLVVLVLGKVHFLQTCGRNGPDGLAGIEGDAFDVFVIRFGAGWPVEARVRSVSRFERRHPDYRGAQARAAFLAAADRWADAQAELVQAGVTSRAARNHLLYVTERLVE